MEKQNYTIRADVRTAAGVGAPHKRERLYWVAYSDIIRRHGGPADTEQKTRSIARLDYNSTDDVMADSSSERLQKQSSEYGVSRQQVIGTARENFTGSGCVGNAASDNEQRNRQSGESIRQQVETGGSGISCVMVQSDSNGCEQGSKTTTTARYRSPINSTSWADPEWIYCRDNKYRPIKPGIKPMVNGVSGRVVSGGDRGTSDDAIAAQGQKETDANNTAEARVMRLKGYGNAIVPQVAAQFILDYCN
jgi:DNA (cytosine-5)-methyltransferase 1